MLTLRRLEPADAVALLTGVHPSEAMAQNCWEIICEERGLRAFAADLNGEMAGFVLAESRPKLVHVLNLEGETGACRLLLDQMVRQAGERNISGWFPVVRTDIHEMLLGLGFSSLFKDDYQGRPSFLFHWERNRDLRA